jgi:hypothetical protein
MATRTKERCDHPEGREKPLGVSGRLEAPHAIFSFSRSLVVIFCAIVRSLVLYVLDIGQCLRLGGGIAAQLVGDDAPRNVLQSHAAIASATGQVHNTHMPNEHAVPDSCSLTCIKTAILQRG